MDEGYLGSQWNFGIIPVGSALTEESGLETIILKWLDLTSLRIMKYAKSVLQNQSKAAVELLGYAPAPGLGGVLVYLSVENLSGHALPVGESYLQSRRVSTREDLYSMGTGVTAACNGRAVRCGSFAAPLYGENAADASIFTLNLAAGRGALLHCFCAVPEDWQTLELIYAPDFAAGRSVTFTVQRGADEAELGMVRMNT